MIRTLAVLANLAQLALVIYLINTNGVPRNPIDWAIFSAFTLVPIVSLATLIANRQPNKDREESTLNLARRAVRAKLQKVADS